MKFKDGFDTALKRIAEYPSFINSEVSSEEFYENWIEWDGNELTEIKLLAIDTGARRGKKECLKDLLSEKSMRFHDDPYEFCLKVQSCTDGHIIPLLSFGIELSRIYFIDLLFKEILQLKEHICFCEKHKSIIPDGKQDENPFWKWDNEIWCKEQEDELQEQEKRRAKRKSLH